MKLYQKIIGITIAFLLASTWVLTFLTIYYNNINLFIIASAGLFPVSLILTIIFMLTYKNHMLRNVFLIGMPFFLVLGFILEIIESYQIIVYLSFLFLVYLVAVNIILHFLRFDLNLIIVIFLLVIGLYMKSQHAAGAGIVMTISMMMTAAFLILIAVKAFKIKDNRYLSIIMFSCSVILALQFIAMVWKLQHWAGAGILLSISLPVFIIATLIILLTLPGSNFLEWTIEQKRILLRGLLIPWLFIIYILITTTLIPPHNEFKPFFFLRHQDKEVFFDMKDYQIENRNGLE
ncbi:MAG: hypothetical protein AMS27_08020 [Bacteroides sp. SM23_62_1]|nr:MAG: hypothetical protein AMS27_08020 [Bacteroides sp. SM23_62_1]